MQETPSSKITKVTIRNVGLMHCKFPKICFCFPSFIKQGLGSFDNISTKRVRVATRRAKKYLASRRPLSAHLPVVALPRTHQSSRLQPSSFHQTPLIRWGQQRRYHKLFRTCRISVARLRGAVLTERVAHGLSKQPRISLCTLIAYSSVQDKMFYTIPPSQQYRSLTAFISN